MQAVVINKTGGVDVLELVQDFPKPSRGPGQATILQAAAAAASMQR
jgi:NADPH:quinone reductase-like Zn-dependent oxidoreductase